MLRLSSVPYLLGLLFFLARPFYSQAQDLLLSGKVVDELEESLIGVNIIEEGQPSNGAVSDIDGNFSIQVSSPDAVLIFSYIGYRETRIQVGTQSVLKVVMKSNAQQLDAVVKTALGIKRQKRELGYSVEQIDGKAVELSNAPNIGNALAGRSAGVQITSGNGVDGGTTRITIRGNNNISGNNQPLIVVDGVPLENDPGLDNIGRGVDWGSALNNINPNDIESIDILKGPTASSKYGSRGSNGVILITTKRGRKQQGIGINYSIQHKIIQPFRYRDVQNEYGAGGPISLTEPTFPTDSEGNLLYPRMVHTDNGPFGQPTMATFGFYSTGVSWGPRMEGQMIRWWDGEIRPFSPQPNNLQQFFSNGETTTHNLS
ncbi:MAG: TonB-dependent receptor plug domain-containing protein, partial [Bacteroidota bacterium]